VKPQPKDPLPAHCGKWWPLSPNSDWRRAELAECRCAVRVFKIVDTMLLPPPFNWLAGSLALPNPNLLYCMYVHLPSGSLAKPRQGKVQIHSECDKRLLFSYNCPVRVQHGSTYSLWVPYIYIYTDCTVHTIQYYCTACCCLELFIVPTSIYLPIYLFIRSWIQPQLLYRRVM